MFCLLNSALVMTLNYKISYYYERIDCESVPKFVMINRFSMIIDYMKYQMVFILVFLFSFTSIAQKTEETLEEKSPKTGAIQSKSVAAPKDTSISIDKLNENWRMQNTQKNELPSALKDRESIQQKGEMANQNDATFWLNSYILNNRSSKHIEELQKAYLIQPTDRKIGEEMAGYSYRVNDFVTSKFILEGLKSKSYITSDQLVYAKDLMAVIPIDGWLICHGFDDSYAVMYEQVVNNHRRDIRLINMDWLTIEEFRQSLRKNGLTVPKSALVNPIFFNEFIASNTNKSFFVSLSIPKAYIADLIGLPFVGTAISTDGLRQNKDEIYQKLVFIKGTKVDGKVINWSKNYLPFLLSYRNELLANGQKNKAKEVEQTMLKIGSWTNTTSKIKQLLE